MITTMALTLAQAQAKLTAAEAALERAMSASTLSTPGLSITTPSIAELRAEVALWRRAVDRLERNDANPSSVGVWAG